jgi:serine beta-lactamase-like protein LACTB
VSSTRSRAEAVLAGLVALVALVVGAGALWSVTRIAVHKDAASVPSSAAGARTDAYAGPIAQSQRRARDFMVRDNIPGLSIAIAVDGEIIWAEGFGWADTASRAPITPRTRFRLGALSKPLTAFAAALLHDRGRLDLDAPIQRYVRAYPTRKWTLTTRHVLGDVGGVHRIRGDGNDAMPSGHCDSVGDGVDLLADDSLQFEPGTQHRYSIWGWVLASAVVEGASGARFKHFMAQQVFGPLGMDRTTTEESADLDDVAHDTARRPDYSCLAGGGAFLSTPSDLVRLGSAMLRPGPLKAETIAAFQTPTRLVSGAPTTYALGWTVTSVQLSGTTTRVVSHRGSPAGGSAALLTFPDLGLAIATTANGADASGIGQFGLQLASAFAHIPRRPH